MSNLIAKIKESIENDNDNKLKELFTKEFIKNKDTFCNFLYVHTPFCPRRCNYCVYTGITEYNKDALNDFIENNLKFQIQKFEEIFNNVKFDMLYFGGGTPNVYNIEQLEHIYDLIPNFRNIPHKTTEVHPAILTKKQIELYKKYNFNLSLGVQTLNINVLKKENRIPVSKRHLKEITDNLENLFYNIDVIAYLDKGTIEDISITIDDLDFILGELQAPSITIHHNGNVEKTREKSLAFINMINDFCEKYNYVCVNSFLNEFDVNLSNSVYKNTFWEPKIIKSNRIQEYIPNYQGEEFPLGGIFTYGFNILALGDKKDRTPLYSHTGNFRYIDDDNKLYIKNKLKKIEWINFLYTLKCYQKAGVKFFTKG